MRIFVAIELTNSIKGELEKNQQKLKGFSEKGRYTDKENFHLTLRFIGECKSEQISLIKMAIDQTTAKQIQFFLNLNKIGSFPKKNRHIIWAGLDGELDKLHNLYNTLEEALVQFGFPKEERPYNPHITLGRQVQLEQSLEDTNKVIQLRTLDFSVKSVSLMESINIDGRLIYRPIYIGEFEHDQS